MKGKVTTKSNQGKMPALDGCHRCGGLMVSEFSAETGTREWHCVTCGERVDQVILAHRQHRGARHRFRPFSVELAHITHGFYCHTRRCLFSRFVPLVWLLVRSLCRFVDFEERMVTQESKEVERA
jgi:hypothetical protein